MLAVIVTTLGDALFRYLLLSGACLAILLIVCVIRSRRKVGHITQVSLKSCEKCGMVFGVGRFHRRSQSVICPRCRKEQFLPLKRGQEREDI